ncbi:lipid A-modifier LpxR family protein [Phenylobacterium sp.]|uniref:lipid A-modifier LpxR family protein n=1 Tax=Phenylobacterium sp. TaxID=1871053 RepID=UPI002F40ABB3
MAVLATVLGCAAASAANAQALSATTPPPSAGASRTLAILNSAAFAPKGPAEAVDPTSALIDHEHVDPGQGLVRWMTGETQISQPGGGAVDSLRVSVGGVIRTPGGLMLTPGRGQYDSKAYEVALTREWPAALAYDNETIGVDVTPHAGLGMTSLGGSAEAGATVRLMQKDAAIKERLNAMGVKDGAAFGDKGRWYLFAAASGRAVGLNMLHGEGGWDRAGMSTDQTSTLVGDTQVGVGWRKGPMQTSFGYIHREVKGQNMLWGVDPGSDNMVAFSFQIRPRF